MGEDVGDMDVVTDKIIAAFEKWFEEDKGFQPHPREYAKRSIPEDGFKDDVLQQLSSWLRNEFPEWECEKASKPKLPGAFGYHYTTDILLVGPRGQKIPIELKLMKGGWEPAAALGQAYMQLRLLASPGGIGAALDRRENVPPYGEAEQKLKDEVWEKFRVRLCVRRGG